MNDLTTVLTAARAMIVTNGWVRGVYEGDCGVCAVGAIRRAGADYDMETTAVRALFKCLPDVHKVALGPFSAVFNWNDHVARSADDVLALFDRAIEVSSD